MGSATHGDAINTAARLESVNKQLGTRICIAGNTTVQKADFIGRPVGDLVLKGRSEAESCFEPLSAEEAASSRIQAYMQAFEKMKQLDPGAISAFQSISDRWPEDPLARYHLNRLKKGQQGHRIILEQK